MAKGKKLSLNLDVLLQSLVSEVSMENSPWWGWVGWMEGSRDPMIFSAVLTTLCTDFQTSKPDGDAAGQQTPDGASVEGDQDGRGEGHSPHFSIW